METLGLALLSAATQAATLPATGKAQITLTATPPSLTNSTSATFGFSGTTILGKSIVNFNCSLDGAPAVSCASPFTASTNLSSAQHTFTVSSAGTAAPVSYIWSVDTIPPSNPNVISSVTNLTTNQLPSLSFNSFDSVGVKSYSCSLDNGAMSACQSPFQVPSSITNGTHTFKVQALDNAGNLSGFGTYSWTYDTVLPTVPVIAGAPASFTNQTGATITIQSTDSLLLMYACTLDGVPYSCGSTTILSGLSNAQHTFAVTSISDSAGNVQKTGASATWTVDTTPPSVALTRTPALNQYGISDIAQPEFTLSASDSGSGLASVNCVMDTQPPVPCGNGTFSPTVSSGTHTLVITATDKAGNTTSTAPYSWTYVTLAAQQAAATATANNNANCVGSSGIGSFYWEVGNATSGSTPLASGSVTAPKTLKVTRDTTMDVDSASKFIFGTYAVEALAGTVNDPMTNSISRKFLQMASGYNTFQDTSCDPNFGTSSDPIASVMNCYQTCCAMTPGLVPQVDTNAPIPCAPGLKLSQIPAGDTLSCNNTYSSSTDGTFYYSGGHFQRFAVAGMSGMSNSSDGDGSVGLQLGSLIGSNGNPTTTLASSVLGELSLGGMSNFAYNFPQLAGGVNTNAADYATVLQNILAGNLQMYNYLGTNPICAWKDSVPGTAPYKCASQYSPIVEEADTYSMGHWVESDPVLGDGAFSSPGKDGFYPWIDQTKNFYGIISRSVNTGSEVGYSSLACGRQIRIAFLKGVQQ